MSVKCVNLNQMGIVLFYWACIGGRVFRVAVYHIVLIYWACIGGRNLVSLNVGCISRCYCVS